MWAISWTARSNASWLAAEGLVVPLTLRTNCSAASCTSREVAGGSKLFSGRMLRHMGDPPRRAGPRPFEASSGFLPDPGLGRVREELREQRLHAPVDLVAARRWRIVAGSGKRQALGERSSGTT